MKRSDSKRHDPRDESGHVEVSPYDRHDGTHVSRHSRRRPMIRGKLKFSYPGRVKGKMTEYRDGKKVQTVKINEPLNGLTELEGK